MPPDADTIDARPDARSGKVRLLCLDDLDGRTRAAQMVSRTIDSIVSDLGGADGLSTGEMLIVRKAAITAAMAEDMASRWLLGQPVDPTAFCTLSNAERRLLETLGLQRRPRDVGPGILDYINRGASQ